MRSVLESLRTLRTDLEARSAPKPGGYYVAIVDRRQAYELEALRLPAFFGTLPPEVRKVQGDMLLVAVVEDMVVLKLRHYRTG